VVGEAVSHVELTVYSLRRELGHVQRFHFWRRSLQSSVDALDEVVADLVQVATLTASSLCSVLLGARMN